VSPTKNAELMCGGAAQTQPNQPCVSGSRFRALVQAGCFQTSALRMQVWCRNTEAMSAQDHRLHGSHCSGPDQFSQAKEFEPKQKQLNRSLIQPGLSQHYAVPHHLPSSRQGSLQDLHKPMWPLQSSHRQRLPGEETLGNPLERLRALGTA